MPATRGHELRSRSGWAPYVIAVALALGRTWLRVPESIKVDFVGRLRKGITMKDAIMRVVRACICGSDLWPYNSMAPGETGQSMGHEAIGVVEETGTDVRTVKRGDVVVMPFAISDGTCEFCHEGLNTACVHVGFFGSNGMMKGFSRITMLFVPSAGTTMPFSHIFIGWRWDCARD